MATNETLSIACICKASPDCGFHSSSRKEMKRHVIDVHHVKRNKTKHFYVLEHPDVVMGFWERLAKMFIANKEARKAAEQSSIKADVEKVG